MLSSQWRVCGAPDDARISKPRALLPPPFALQGAVSLVGSTVGASPLLLALQLAEAVERQAAAARKTASRQAPASSADAAEGRAAAAERVCSELLAGWSEEQTKDLLNAKLDGPQAQRVSALLERHADTLLTPFLQASTPGRGVAELSSSAGGVGKGGRVGKGSGQGRAGGRAGRVWSGQGRAEQGKAAGQGRERGTGRAEQAQQGGWAGWGRVGRGGTAGQQGG